MSALTISKALAIPILIGRGIPMEAAVVTLRSAERYGRASSVDGSLTVVYDHGKYTLT